ncbi:hypothetical protein BZU18_18815 [Salmonella enterica subsp. enterica serovar Shubra]|nr:hypothetical protein [Salmonella enterica subsp. enterica serovar Shubra]
MKVPLPRRGAERYFTDSGCFPRSVEIHEEVIGSFIEKHVFY